MKNLLLPKASLIFFAVLLLSSCISNKKDANSTSQNLTDSLTKNRTDSVKGNLASNKKNDWTKMHLKGTAKSYTNFTYFAVYSSGKIIKGQKRDYFQNKFSEKGNYIERNNYKSDGSLKAKWIFKYDDKGNKIELNKFNSEGIFTGKSTSKYDDKGNKIELSRFNSEGTFTSKNTFKYDDKGNKIEESRYSSDGSLREKRTKKHDDKGNEIEVISFNSDGSLKGKDTYKYEFDEIGNWIKRIRYDRDIAKTITEREYEYFE